MNPFEFYRAFEKLTPDKLRELMVNAVHQNSDEVIQDSIIANVEGLTFAGNKIEEYAPFSDWEETGEFHEKLNFLDKNNIEFTSSGKGAESIFSVFPENDTIAPHAKTLDPDTISRIKQKFIEQINNTLQ